MKKSRKKIITVLAAFGGVLVLALAVMVIYIARPQKNPSGILLAFDDYYPENWEAHFELFDKYDVNVTFFINAAYPTDFCYKALERGHEIGFHTMSHVNLTEVPEEEVWQEAVVPVENFKNKGIELTTFAYPYGASTVELDELLLQHYKVVRGGYHYELIPKEQFKSGYVESRPIDNANIPSDMQYKLRIIKMLVEAKLQDGTMVSVYSHGIESGDTCIRPERLEFLFQMADFLNLEFYTYKELQ